MFVVLCINVTTYKHFVVPSVVFLHLSIYYSHSKSSVLYLIYSFVQLHFCLQTWLRFRLCIFIILFFIISCSIVTNTCFFNVLSLMLCNLNVVFFMLLPLPNLISMSNKFPNKYRFLVHLFAFLSMSKLSISIWRSHPD